MYTEMRHIYIGIGLYDINVIELSPRRNIKLINSSYNQQRSDDFGNIAG